MILYSLVSPDSSYLEFSRSDQRLFNTIMWNYAQISQSGLRTYYTSGLTLAIL